MCLKEKSESLQHCWDEMRIAIDTRLIGFPAHRAVSFVVLQGPVYKARTVAGFHRDRFIDGVSEDLW